MAIGIKARYRMPEFRALAGFSPNCCAVLVQIEHCADAIPVDKEKTETNKTCKAHLLIAKNFYKCTVLCYSDNSLFKAGLCNFMKALTPGLPG